MRAKNFELSARLLEGTRQVFSGGFESTFDATIWLSLVRNIGRILTISVINQCTKMYCVRG